jgi:hypothetical protein
MAIPGLLPPGFEAFKTAKILNIILHIGHFDRIGGYFLQTDCAAKNRATVFVGTLRHQCTRRAAMTGIHTPFLETPECSVV